MFEGWVAGLFNRFLGSYVEESCFRPEKVSTSVYNGHVVLSELEVKKDAFDFVEAPIKLKRGFIGQVEFKIPWTKLGAQPLEISIDRVFLVFQPSLEYNEQEYKRKMKARKKADIARAELHKSSGSLFGDGSVNGGAAAANANGNESEQLAKAGFTARLMNKIVDNIELTVKNVHIRYEDHGVTHEHHSFAVGVTLESLKMQSTDKNWKPCFVDLVKEVEKRLGESGKFLDKLLAYKLFRLGHFALYWDPLRTDDTRLLDYDFCTFAEMAAIFERMIPKRRAQEDDDFRHIMKEKRSSRNKKGVIEEDDERHLRDVSLRAAAKASSMKGGSQQQHRFILRPVSVTLKLRSNRDPRFPEGPDTMLDVNVDTVTLALESFQFVDAWEMFATFDAVEKSYRHAKFRPDVSIKHHPKVWWNFAIRAVMEDVTERRRRFSGDYIIERHRKRLEYIELWKRNLVGRPTAEVQQHQAKMRRRFQNVVSQSHDYEHSPIQKIRRDMMIRGAQISASKKSPGGGGSLGGGSALPSSSSSTASTMGGSTPLTGSSSSSSSSTSPADEPSQQSPYRRQGPPRMYEELSKEGKQILDQLEEDLDVGDIMYFRSLAENQLRLERAYIHLLNIEKRTGLYKGEGDTYDADYDNLNVVDEESSGWASSLFGWAGWAVGMRNQSSTSSSSSSSTKTGASKSGMTMEEQEFLLQMLDFDPTQVLDDDRKGQSVTSPGRIDSITRFRLVSGSVELWTNEDRSKSMPKILVDGHFDGLKVKVSSRENGTSQMDMSLQNIVVYDRCSGSNSRFSRIVSLKGFGAITSSQQEQLSSYTSTLSEFEMDSHATPPSWSGIAERMEQSYKRRKQRERVERIRRARLERIRRQQDAIGGGAAWAATLGGFDVSSDVGSFDQPRDIDLDSFASPDFGVDHDEDFDVDYNEDDEDEIDEDDDDDDDDEEEEEEGDEDEEHHNGEQHADSTNLNEMKEDLNSPVRDDADHDRVTPSYFGDKRSRGKQTYSPSKSRQQRKRTLNSKTKSWGKTTSGKKTGKRQVVFSMSVDTYCPDNNADLSLTVRLRPLELIYSPTCLDQVSKFFEVPKSVFMYKEMQLASINRLSTSQLRTEAKMEYAYRNHVGISMDVDIQAPLLIVPQANAPTEDATNLLLIDFGRMTIKDRALSSIKSKKQGGLGGLSDSIVVDDSLGVNVSGDHANVEDDDIIMTTPQQQQQQQGGGTVSSGNGYTNAAPDSATPQEKNNNSGTPSTPLPSRTRVASSSGLVGSGGASARRRPSFISKSGKHKRNMSQNDMQHFFDEYAVTCSNVEIMVTNATAPWRSTLDQQRLRMHILEKFTFNVVVCVSILPYDRTLPKLKLFASLPSLHLHISPEKYIAMLKIAESINSMNDKNEGGAKASDHQHDGEETTSLIRANSFMRLTSLSSLISSPTFSTAGTNNHTMLPTSTPPQLGAASPSSMSQQNSSWFLQQQQQQQNPSTGDSVDHGHQRQSSANNSFLESGSVMSARSTSTRQERFLTLKGSHHHQIDNTTTTTGASSTTTYMDGEALPHEKSGIENGGDLDDSASISASMFETLRNMEDGEENSVLFHDPSPLEMMMDEDFYTTIGSVATRSRKPSRSGASVGSFVSANDGGPIDDEESRSEITPDPNHTRRTNISVLQCSLSIDFIVISLTREKICTATQRASSANPDVWGGASDQNDSDRPFRFPQHGSTPGTVEEAMNKSREEGENGEKLPAPVIKPYVREWLDEIEKLEQGSPNLFPYDQSASRQIHHRSSSMIHDEALDEILASENFQNPQGEEKQEEGIVLVLFDNISMNVTIRTMDTALNLNLKSLTVRDIFGKDVSNLVVRSVNGKELQHFPVILHSNVDTRRNSGRTAVFSTIAQLRTASEVDGPENRNVLSIEFHGLAKDSPLYAGVGVTVSCKLNSLDLTFDQKIVAAFLDCFMRSEIVAPLPEENPTIAKPQQQSTKTTKKASSSSSKPPVMTPPNMNALQANIIASLKSLRITFVGEGTLLKRSKSDKSGKGDVDLMDSFMNIGDDDGIFYDEDDEWDATSPTNAWWGRSNYPYGGYGGSNNNSYNNNLGAAYSSNARSTGTPSYQNRNLMGKSKSGGYNAGVIPLAELVLGEFEVRHIQAEDGQSTSSGQLGMFVLNDMITGLNTMDQQQNQQGNQTFTIPEQSFAPLDQEPVRVQLIGSRRRESDKRPLFLFHSNSFSKANREQMLWTVSPAVQPHHQQQQVMQAEGDEETVRQEQGSGAAQQEMENEDELDLDAVLESYLHDESPPSSPRRRGGVGDRFHQHRRWASSCSSITQGDGFCQHRDCKRRWDNRRSKAMEQNVAHAPVPGLPLENDIQVQLRSLAFRFNMEFCRILLDYVYYGPMVQVLRKKMEERTHQSYFRGAGARHGKTSQVQMSGGQLALNMVAASLDDIYLEFPSSQRGSPVGILHIETVSTRNNFFLGASSQGEIDFAFQKYPQYARVMHAIESTNIDVRNVHFTVPFHNMQNGVVAPIKILDDTTINAKLVRYAGCAGVRSRFFKNTMNQDIWWKWELVGVDPTDCDQENVHVKAKVTVSKVGIHVAEPQVVSLLGITDHIASIDADDIQAKVNELMRLQKSSLDDDDDEDEDDEVEEEERLVGNNNSNKKEDAEGEHREWRWTEKHSVCTCSTIYDRAGSANPLRSLPSFTLDAILKSMQFELLSKQGRQTMFRSPPSFRYQNPKVRHSFSSFATASSSGGGGIGLNPNLGASPTNETSSVITSFSTHQHEFTSLVTVEVGECQMWMTMQNERRQELAASVANVKVSDTRPAHQRDVFNIVFEGLTSPAYGAEADSKTKQQSQILRSTWAFVDDFMTSHEKFTHSFSSVRFTFTEGLFLQTFEWLVRVEDAATLESLWPPKLPDISFSKSNTEDHHVVVQPQNGGSTVMGKMEENTSRSGDKAESSTFTPPKSIIQEGSLGKFTASSSKSKKRGDGFPDDTSSNHKKTTTKKKQGESPPTTTTSATKEANGSMESVSNAPAYSYESDSDKLSETRTGRLSMTKTPPPSIMRRRSSLSSSIRPRVVKNKQFEIQVSCKDIELCVVERPKQVSSRLLAVKYSFDVFSKETKTIKKTRHGNVIRVNKPEWTVDLNSCSAVIYPDARGSVDQYSSALVHPFSGRIVYVGALKGSHLHTLTINMEDINAKITYNEIQMVTTIGDRIGKAFMHHFLANGPDADQEGQQLQQQQQNVNEEIDSSLQSQQKPQQPISVGKEFRSPSFTPIDRFDEEEEDDLNTTTFSTPKPLTRRSLSVPTPTSPSPRQRSSGNLPTSSRRLLLRGTNGLLTGGGDNDANPEDGENLPLGRSKTKATMSGLKVSLEISGAQFLLVDDLVGQNASVVKLYSKEIKTTLSIDRNASILIAEQALSANYFNHRLGEWEPLMEPWKLRVDGLIPTQSRKTKTLQISSKDNININVTEAFVETISGASKIFNPDYQLYQSIQGPGASSNTTSSSSTSKPGNSASDMANNIQRNNDEPYRVKNLTGLTVAMWVGDRRRQAIMIGSGDEVPLRFRDFEVGGNVTEDAKGTTRRQKKKICFLFHSPQWSGGRRKTHLTYLDNMSANSSNSQRGHQKSPWQPLLNVPIEREGSFLYTLPGTANPQSKISLVCDVVSSFGFSKLICIRSTLLVRNRCIGPMELSIANMFEKVISPGEVVPIPVHVAEHVNSSLIQMAIRPVTYSRPFKFQNVKFPNTITADCTVSSAIRGTLFFKSSDISSHTAIDLRSGMHAVEALTVEDKKQGGFIISGRDSALRLVSFESPLLLSNLLASSITYRLRANSSADGQLHVGGSLRWQGVDPGNDLSLAIRLPGFDWSTVLKIGGVPFLNIRAKRKNNNNNTSNNGASSSSSTTGSITPGEDGNLNDPMDNQSVSSNNTSENRGDGYDALETSSLTWSAISEKVTSDVTYQTIELKDANRRTLNVTVETQILPGGTRKIDLYVPYWIVNLSDLHLLVRSASRSVAFAETFGGHIAAGQNEAIAVMRRLRMRQKLGEMYSYQRGVGFAGHHRAPGGLLDILDDSNVQGDRRSGEPLMFGYTDERRKKGRICVKAADSGWSQAMGLDSAGTTGVIELKQQWNVVKSDKPRQVSVLGVSIAVADGKFSRTKVITLTPRFVLINALGRTLTVQQRQTSFSGPGQIGILGLLGAAIGKTLVGSYRQPNHQYDVRNDASMLSSLSAKSSSAMSIRSSERVPFHWSDANCPRELCVRFDEYGWVWSGGFAIDQIGEFYVRLRNEHTHAVYILRVDISLDKSSSSSSTILITFRPEVSNLPPYRIDNLSLHTLRLQQRGAPPQTQEVLLPYHSTSYTWDDLSLQRSLVVESLVNKSALYKWKGSKLQGGGSVFRKMTQFLGGVWGMLWDQQASMTQDLGQSYPVVLGYFDLDRLQPSTPSTALPHINISVHADGPTRVLSIVDARNKVHDEDGATSRAETVMMIEGKDGSKNQLQQQQQHLQQQSGSKNLSWWEKAFSSQIGETETSKTGDNNILKGVSSLDATANANKLVLSGEEEEQESSVELYLSFKGIGISVVESLPCRELLYLSILDIQSEIGTVGDLSRVVVKVGWIQVDNQLYTTYYPVLLAPRYWNRSAGVNEGMVIMDEYRPFAEFCLVTSNKFPSLDFVRYISFLVLPMNLKLEPDLLGALMGFVTRCSVITSSSKASAETRDRFLLHEPISFGNAMHPHHPHTALSVGSPSTRTPLQKKTKSMMNLRRGTAGNLPSHDVVLSGGREATDYYRFAALKEESENSLSTLDLIEHENKFTTGGMQHQQVGTPQQKQQQQQHKSMGVSSLSSSSLSRVGKLTVDNVDFNSKGGVGMSRVKSPSSAASSSVRSVRGAESFPATQRKLYIEELHIHPVKIHVSFTFRHRTTLYHPRLSLSKDPQRKIEVDDDQPQQQQQQIIHFPQGMDTSLLFGQSRGSEAINPLRFVLNAMGATLVNVENAPLRLNALVIHNSLSSGERVLGNIMAHYRSQAIRQAYLILGSVDLLGDPRGLVKNLGAGVLDFFYEPALGLVRSPKDFGAGIAKGTTSLFRRVILGAATSATGFANGVSALFEALSNDRFTGFKPKTVVEGCIQGVAGLVVAPMNGFQEEGISGLLQGSFYGVIGLFVKPLAGLLKLVKRVSTAIQSTIDPTVKLRRHRLRPPRAFTRLPLGDDGMNRILEPYDLRKAIGEQIIAIVDHGIYFEEGCTNYFRLSVPEKLSGDEEDSQGHSRLPSPRTLETQQQVEALERANKIFTYYTIHERRPFRKLTLWKDMFLVLTRDHLLYVEDNGEYERSTWVVALEDILDVECRYNEQVVDDEEGQDGSESVTSNSKKAKPNLAYWLIVVNRKVTGSSQVQQPSGPPLQPSQPSQQGSREPLQQKLYIYTWTKFDADKCHEFILDGLNKTM